VLSSNDELQPGAPVRIGGRTMLSPTLSISGLRGVVVPTFPNAPSGCLTVAVAWEVEGYTRENGYDPDDLPRYANVPGEHLTRLNEAEIEAFALAVEAALTPPAELSLVEESADVAPPVSDEESPKEEQERPKLRLI
jgi:hypothetical protein